MKHAIAIALVTATAGVAAAEIAKEPPVQGAPAATRRAVNRPSSKPPAPPPAPPGEIGQLGKAIAGTYKCKGVTLHSDGSSTPLVATVTIKLELDGAWIVTSLAEVAKGGLRFTEYRTYDPVGKQWTRIQLANTTGHVLSTSLGEKDGKWTWEGTATSPQGTTSLRDFEQRDGKQLKVWGEALLGGSWQKMYEATCTK